jgi:hypothetical protein
MYSIKVRWEQYKQDMGAFKKTDKELWELFRDIYIYIDLIELIDLNELSQKQIIEILEYISVGDHRINVDNKLRLNLLNRLLDNSEEFLLDDSIKFLL